MLLQSYLWCYSKNFSWPKEPFWTCLELSNFLLSFTIFVWDGRFLLKKSKMLGGGTAVDSLLSGDLFWWVYWLLFFKMDLKGTNWFDGDSGIEWGTWFWFVKWVWDYLGDLRPKKFDTSPLFVCCLEVTSESSLSYLSVERFLMYGLM